MELPTFGDIAERIRAVLTRGPIKPRVVPLEPLRLDPPDLLPAAAVAGLLRELAAPPPAAAAVGTPLDLRLDGEWGGQATAIRAALAAPVASPAPRPVQPMNLDLDFGGEVRDLLAWLREELTRPVTRTKAPEYELDFAEDAPYLGWDLWSQLEELEATFGEVIPPRPVRPLVLSLAGRTEWDARQALVKLLRELRDQRPRAATNRPLDLQVPRFGGYRAEIEHLLARFVNQKKRRATPVQPLELRLDFGADILHLLRRLRPAPTTLLFVPEIEWKAPGLTLDQLRSSYWKAGLGRHEWPKRRAKARNDRKANRRRKAAARILRRLLAAKQRDLRRSKKRAAAARAAQQIDPEFTERATVAEAQACKTPYVAALLTHLRGLRERPKRGKGGNIIQRLLRGGATMRVARWSVPYRLWSGYVPDPTRRSGRRWVDNRRVYDETLPQVDWPECWDQAGGDTGQASRLFRGQVAWVHEFIPPAKLPGWEAQEEWRLGKRNEDRSWGFWPWEWISDLPIQL